MAENHLEDLFSKLINNILNFNNKITIFIGAGCSLTSSETNITTYGIVEDLVKRHSDNKSIPQNWIELYERFVNDIWNGQGNQNRIQLLDEYFKNMVPSVGYTALRWLVENNYVSNIITTNFDLMIDTVLQGISYNLIVGDNFVKNENSNITVIKAHGDLNHGEIRFSPEELIKLPEELSKKIQECSKGTLIVTGYKGQDIGVLEAIDKSGEYNAYWTSPKEIDRYDSYNNHQIISLMNSRKSNNNYLFGDKYGKFDELLNNLKYGIQEKLELKQAKEYRQIGDLWLQCSWLWSHLENNKRFCEIFYNLFIILSKTMSQKKWQSKSPYFCSSYISMIKKVIKILSESIFPETLLDCVKNEVDALVFSLAIVINFVSFGCKENSERIIDVLKSEFHVENTSVFINDDFWNVVIQLTKVKTSNDIQYRNNNPLIFYFDKDNNFQTVLKYVDFSGMKKLIISIQLLLLFYKTSENYGNNISLYKLKEILERNVYSINVVQNKIKLQMSKIPIVEYEDIKSSILNGIFKEYCIEDERILTKNNIHITFVLEESIKPKVTSIWEAILTFSKVKKESFYNDFNSDVSIRRNHINIFNEFLNSNSNGLFIIGNSGSGKTTSLQLWSRLLDESKYCVCPIFGKEFDINNDQLNMFFNTDNLHNINQMLSQREQILVFIIDAINEIYDSFSNITSFYIKTLDFCNCLSKKQFNNIKVVVSSRTDFYQQLKNHTGIEPSCVSFYSIYSENTYETNSIFEVPLLNNNEINSFIKVLNPANNLNGDALYSEFGELITLPFNLKLICELDDKGENIAYSNNNIFEIWFDKISNLASIENISMNTLLAIINKMLEFKYFVTPRSIVQTYMVFSNLNDNYLNILPTYEWLLEQHIFVKNITNPNLIQFSHDKLEEFFLFRYLNSEYINNLAIIDTIMNIEVIENPIVKQSLYKVIINLFECDKLIFITQLVAVVNNSSTLSIWAEAIILLLSSSPNATYDLIIQLEQYITKNKYINFIEYILHYIDEKIDNMNYIEVSVIKLFGEVINSTNCNTNKVLSIYSKFLEAKCLFVFADKTDSNVFKKALCICNDLESDLIDNIPLNLLDSLHYLKALLYQNQGDLNSAIELMETCYKNQTSKAAYNLACKSAVNLGAMYREMTRFDDAISLYEGIKTEYITDLEFKYRLIMNKGIIYKNKIQNSQFDGKNNSNKSKEYYNIASKCFNETYDYAVNADNVKLLLEICAEFVELSCIAYNMGRGTINDAVSWGKKLDLYITKCDVPVERIQYHRMWARILTLSCKFEEAINHLEKGYAIADKYGIIFRAADCCSQTTGIICDMINQNISIPKNILKKGKKCSDYAISYYKSLNNPNHRYLKNALYKQQLINDYYNNLS